MASLYRFPCKETALSCVGYTSKGLWNMYAERLDQCDFFADCGKKNGAVDYCGIAFCYWLFMNVVIDSGDISDNDRKYMTHYAMYQSDNCCTSAGCTQQSDVYKNNNAWFTNPQDLQVMDQVFFQKSNGAIYHTGACTDFDNEGAYITEANVEGRQTLTRFYKYSEFGNKIAGFGRPRFDGWKESENSSVIVPDNKLKFDPDICHFCQGITLTVNTKKDPLNLRVDGNINSTVILQMPKGSKVLWKGYFKDNFYLVNYNGIQGYACGDYLKI